MMSEPLHSPPAYLGSSLSWTWSSWLLGGDARALVGQRERELWEATGA